MQYQVFLSNMNDFQIDFLWPIDRILPKNKFSESEGYFKLLRASEIDPHD